ncbi:hypothetical protein NST08_23595 [Paenibacillus sp. FSL K6-1566]|uniref:hypothetical protein n=1 Tax=Paenibacillus sp. FSL K6-1566 TaxID=2954515 RepID=UPI003100F699
MLSVRFVLAVQDSRYVEPLLNYVNGSSYSSSMQITAFTRQDAFLHYMESGEPPALVVGDAEMLMAWFQLGDPAVPWLLLNDGAGMPASCPAGGSHTAKYQPLPKLLEAISARCHGSSTFSGGSNGISGGAGLQTGMAAVIGVLSPLSGCGKSTLAMNMAKQFAVLGLRVFYLNLESVNSSVLFPSGCDGMEGSFSRLLYDIKAAQEGGSENVLQVMPYRLRHQGLKCDTFEPSLHVKEIMEMTRSDTELLLRSLGSAGQYDVIVVDTDGASGVREERLQAVLEHTGALIWVLLDDPISMFKSGIRIDQLLQSGESFSGGLMKRSRFVVNRYTGQLVNRPPRQDIRIDCMLPYIPSWKQLHQQELLLMSPIYQREVLKLCRQLLGGGDFGLSGENRGELYA